MTKPTQPKNLYITMFINNANSSSSSGQLAFGLLSNDIVFTTCWVEILKVPISILNSLVNLFLDALWPLYFGGSKQEERTAQRCAAADMKQHQYETQDDIKSMLLE